MFNPWNFIIYSAMLLLAIVFFNTWKSKKNKKINRENTAELNGFTRGE